MIKFQWIKVLIICFVTVIVILLLYRLAHSSNVKKLANYSSATPTPQPQATKPFAQTTIIVSPTLTQTPSVSQNNVTTSIPISQVYGGHITCSYEIPAAPGQYGTAVINSSWQNIRFGKTGAATAELCVKPSDKSSSIIFTDHRISGSRVDNAPWISVGVNYVFTLYDEYGGDDADCSGTVLSSCQISTND